MTTPDRVADYVGRFNEAVASRDWAAFAAGLTDDAEMVFTNRPVGPFVGRAAIDAAYRAQPPDDTLVVESVETDGTFDAVDAHWSRGGRLLLELTWRDDRVARVAITFA